MSCFLAAIFSVLGVAKNADDVANAKTKLTMAETAHQTAEEEFRKAVGEHFDELEKKASNRGDRKSLGQIAAQREAFKSRCRFPLRRRRNTPSNAQSWTPLTRRRFAR
jgi:hypothetical protein